MLKDKGYKQSSGSKPSSSSSSRKSLKKRSSEKTSALSSSSGGVGASSQFQALFAQRTNGFLIDLSFRNAPPRPPVGPCFVGQGLEGALHDWTVYQPRNALETHYSFALHSEPDLGVPLAPSAMDALCYIDPTKEKALKHASDGDYDMFEDDDDDEDDTKSSGPPPLHPADVALMEWTGPTGDTNAIQLQKLRDRARAAALLGTKPPTTSSSAAMQALVQLRKASKGFTSRVLKEKNPFFMKKTTYLDNDVTKSVHSFESLAMAKQKEEKRIAQQLAQANKRSDKDVIRETFEQVVTSNTKRAHPSKKNVVAEWEVPLLPDVSTWGHTLTHVVLDKIPQVGPPAKRRKVSPTLLKKSFIADVVQAPHQSTTTRVPRRQCHLLIDKNPQADQRLYAAAQLYDFHIHHLKAHDGPHVNFVFKVDPKNKVATYHVLSNRIQLVSGRPADRKRTKRFIKKRPLRDEERVEMEKRVAEVDMDLSKKHGLDDDDVAGEDGALAFNGDNGNAAEQQRFLGADVSSDSEAGF